MKKRLAKKIINNRFTRPLMFWRYNRECLNKYYKKYYDKTFPMIYIPMPRCVKAEDVPVIQNDISNKIFYCPYLPIERSILDDGNPEQETVDIAAELINAEEK